MTVIPAIDLIDGKCVRLTQGDYSRKKVYTSNPVKVAKDFAQLGFRQIHVVDLDGARLGKTQQTKVLAAIRKETDLVIDWGGGMHSKDDVQTAFDAGADKVTLGTVAARDRHKTLGWLDKYGPEKLILGADVRNRQIAVSGWTESTALDVLEFIGDYIAAGFKEVICTDVTADGTLEGPSLDLYREILASTPDVRLIASGGVGSINDIQSLRSIGIRRVIVGKAIYEGKLDLKYLGKLC